MPDFPDRFGSLADARAFCDRFFTAYNHEHRHSGIGMHTPASVHFDTATRDPGAAVKRPSTAPTPSTPSGSTDRPRPPRLARAGVDQPTRSTANLIRSTVSVDLTATVHAVLDAWRPVAWLTSARGAAGYRRILARAEQVLRTGERPPGTVSLEATRLAIAEQLA